MSKKLMLAALQGCVAKRAAYTDLNDLLYFTENTNGDIGKDKWVPTVQELYADRVTIAPGKDVTDEGRDILIFERLADVSSIKLTEPSSVGNFLRSYCFFLG